MKKMWQSLNRPSLKWASGSLLLVGLFIGIIFWGGLNWAMEMTNKEAFCISCHTMRDNVYQEYRETVHFNNGSGVRAICADCHVPKEWIHKVKAKILAAKDVYHTILGTIDTKEKFEHHRQRMAEMVWAKMRASNSRECRACHDFESMDPDEQSRSAKSKHKRAVKKGETCIDCHQGVAHTLPDDVE